MSTEQTQEGAPPAEGGGSGLQLTDEQQAVLAEHGITVPDDGKISIADHVKLLSTLNTLKGKVRTSEQAQEQARLAAMNEADRKIEEARLEGRREAETAAKAELAKARIEAAAIAKGFNDPKDAFSMIPDYSALDAEDAIRSAVDRLATDKPYLIKQAPAPRTQLEQGPQGTGKAASSESANAWLREQMMNGSSA